MVEKVKITNVSVKNTKADGTAFMTKDNKPFWNVGIQTDKHGDAWMSCLAFAADDKVMKLAVGQEIDLIVEKNGTFTNFKIPTKVDLIEARVARIEETLFGGAKVEAPEVPATEGPATEGPADPTF